MIVILGNQMPGVKAKLLGVVRLNARAVVLIASNSWNYGSIPGHRKRGPGVVVIKNWAVSSPRSLNVPREF